MAVATGEALGEERIALAAGREGAAGRRRHLGRGGGNDTECENWNQNFPQGSAGALWNGENHLYPGSYSFTTTVN